MFKKTISTIALIAATSTGAFAGCYVAPTQPSDNFIQKSNRYDASTSGTVAGVVVRIDGQTTHYDVGDLGLTREVVFDECGDVSEAWAKNALGADVTLLTEPLRGRN